MTQLDSDTLNAWVGKSETSDDTIDARPLVLLSATLDRDDAAPRAGDAVPPLWHWLYFLPAYRQSEVGQRGGVGARQPRRRPLDGRGDHRALGRQRARARKEEVRVAHQRACAL